LSKEKRYLELFPVVVYTSIQDHLHNKQAYEKDKN
jgi:hypothetical protein